MDRYLGGEEIDEKVLTADLERAVARATFFPVVPVCSVTGVGCAELLDLMTRAFPSPSEHPPPAGVHARGRAGRRDRVRPRRPARRRGREDDQRPVRRPAQPGPGLLRHAPARRVGARVRPLHLVLRRGLRPRGPRRGREDRRPLLPLRQEPGPGRAGRRRRPVRDRPAVPRRDRRHPLLRRRPAGAEAVVAARAAAAGRDRRQEQGRRGQAVPGAGPARRRGPDPAGREQRRDPPARAVVHGRGARRRRARAAGRAVRRATSTPVPFIVSLRETFAGKGTGKGRHVKQSGGHGQYAVCDIEVEPLPEGVGLRVRRQGRRRRPCPASSSRASRRASAPRWSAVCATATRSSTSG